MVRAFWVAVLIGAAILGDPGPGIPDLDPPRDFESWFIDRPEEHGEPDPGSATIRPSSPAVGHDDAPAEAPTGTGLRTLR